MVDHQHSRRRDVFANLWLDIFESNRSSCMLNNTSQKAFDIVCTSVTRRQESQMVHPSIPIQALPECGCPSLTRPYSPSSTILFWQICFQRPRRVLDLSCRELQECRRRRQKRSSSSIVLQSSQWAEFPNANIKTNLLTAILFLASPNVPILSLGRTSPKTTHAKIEEAGLAGEEEKTC